jgi:nucleoside-diphosphate-sugar epimerase
MDLAMRDQRVQKLIDVVEPPPDLTAPREVRPARPTVLVLGATGCIGRALVERLHQDGIVPRALVRDLSGRAQWLARRGVDLVKGDIADTATVAAALDGIEHVVHLARSAGPAWGDYLRLDVEPTRRLAELCCARGIGLTYTSSIAIYDGGREADRITESTPPSRAAMRLNVYARAKVTTEHLLADLHRRQGLKLVIFRPGIVIGGGADPRHPGVGAWPNPSTCRPWGGGRHRLPFVLVDDCADAMVRALRVSDIAGESFNLIGDACLSGNDYLDALERSAGIHIQRSPQPAWRLFAQSVARSAIKLLAGAPEHPVPSYRYCDGLSCRATYVADLAKQRLGWLPASDPAVFIERGLAATVAECVT